MSNTLAKVKTRNDPSMTLSIQERIDQILPLTETIIKDVNEIANLDRLPANIILRARASVWLALSYELFSIYEPEHINVAMLSRLVKTNM